MSNIEQGTSNVEGEKPCESVKAPALLPDVCFGASFGKSVAPAIDSRWIGIFDICY